VRRIVVGKCDEDHRYQGNYRKDEQAHHRQREQGDVEFVVQQIIYVFFEVLRLFTDDAALLKLVTLSCCDYVANNKENDNEKCENTVQKDQKRVVADYFIVNALVLIPKVVCFDATYVAAAEEVFKAHCKIIATEKYHIEHESSLKQQVNYTANDLTAEKVAESHYKVRGLRQSVAVPEVLTEFLESASYSDKKSGDSVEYTSKEACDTLADILEKLRDLIDEPLPRCQSIIIEIH
jgi:hypothetical protein